MGSLSAFIVILKIAFCLNRCLKDGDEVSVYVCVCGGGGACSALHILLVVMNRSNYLELSFKKRIHLKRILLYQSFG